MSEMPEIIYKDENCFITDQQKLSEFQNYSISSTGIIACNSDIGNHHRGDFWNIQKKTSISLYDRNGQKVKVDLLILIAREFIGVDTTGTYTPMMKSQAGLMIASNITYHYTSLKKISNKVIEVDGIKYHKVSKSKYTYISKDGIAFNYKEKDFQIRQIQPNGDCEIKLDMTDNGGSFPTRKFNLLYSMHIIRKSIILLALFTMIKIRIIIPIPISLQVILILSMYELCTMNLCRKIEKMFHTIIAFGYHLKQK